jgi:hypothetical protein
MAVPHVVSTLKNKRNELEARIEAYQREIENVRRGLAASDATLALFLQEGELRPHIGLARMFRRGEMFCLCKAVLEASGRPLETGELARAIAEEKGLDGQGKVLRKALAVSIVNMMALQAERGTVFAAGKRSGVRIWQLCCP